MSSSRRNAALPTLPGATRFSTWGRPSAGNDRFGIIASGAVAAAAAVGAAGATGVVVSAAVTVSDTGRAKGAISEANRVRF